MDEIIKIKDSAFFKRIIVILSICIVLLIFKKIINVLLLTLIFVLLSTRFTSFVKAKTRLPQVLIVSILYAFIIAVLYFLFNNFFSQISSQSTKIVDTVTSFYSNPDDDNIVLNWIAEIFNQFDLKNELNSWANLLVNYATNITEIGVSIFISFLLSFFYTLESKRVEEFSRAFLDSRFSWFFNEVRSIGQKFIGTFGIVLETQFIIASINTIITILALSFLGFPQLPTLAVMIFILGLIPVAGVIISCIPLAFIGFAIGGINMIIYVLIMIAVVHALETYFLNPHLMSSRTKLPVFYVFLVLFLAEKIFGVWGLIVGIPIFIFILDLLEVKVDNRKPKLSKLREKNEK